MEGRVFVGKRCRAVPRWIPACATAVQEGGYARPAGQHDRATRVEHCGVGGDATIGRGGGKEAGSERTLAVCVAPGLDMFRPLGALLNGFCSDLDGFSIMLYPSRRRVFRLAFGPVNSANSRTQADVLGEWASGLGGSCRSGIGVSELGQGRNLISQLLQSYTV